jgi:hypothetical protein
LLTKPVPTGAGFRHLWGTAEATGRAKNTGTGLFQGPGLIGGRNERRRCSRRGDAGKIGLFKKQWALQDHFDLGSGCESDIGPAGEEADNSRCGCAGGEAAESAGQGVT